MYTFAQIRKAVVAGAGAALFAGIGELAHGFADGVLSAPEAGTALGVAAGAFALVGGAVFKVKNAD